MASTFRLTSGSYQGRYLELYCTQEKIISENKSKISWTLSSIGGSSNYYGTGPTTVKINGNQVYYCARKNWETKEFPAAKGSTSGYTYVSHDTNGSKSITVEFSTAIYVGEISTYSGNWELENIPRSATALTAENFTDEQNPSITFSNPGGLDIVPYINIYDKNNNIVYIIDRNKGKYTSPFKFTLTDEERTAIRNACNKQETYETWQGVYTYIGDTYLGHSSNYGKLTIANASPVISGGTVVDDNKKSIAVTGDKNTLVRYISTAKISGVSVEWKKGATSASLRFKNGNGYSEITDGEARLYSVVSGDFTVEATDSRGISTQKNYTNTIIPYVIPTITAKCARETPTSGTIKATYKGNVYSAWDFTVRFKYKEKYSEQWSEYNELPTVTNGDTYSNGDTEVILGNDFDYKKSYDFCFEIIDPIYDGTGSYIKSYTVNVLQGIPIFDWGENDFNFNVPLKYQGNQMDFIVEYGEENGWRYEKYNSGVLKQWTIITPTFTSWVSWRNAYWYYGSPNCVTTFGVPFIAQPVVEATNFSTSWAIPVIEKVTNLKFEITGVRPDAGATSSGAYYYSIFAVGRWKE
ncbi:MAG: hypothetical protein ACI4IK_02890 [Eubacterium sp.]